MRRDYRLIFKQEFIGKILQDTIIKYDKTVAEMEDAVTAVYSDPHVFSVWYEEVKG